MWPWTVLSSPGWDPQPSPDVPVTAWETEQDSGGRTQAQLNASDSAEAPNQFR